MATNGTARTILLVEDDPIIALDQSAILQEYGYVLKTSGEFVLLETLNMALALFEARKEAERSRDLYQSIVLLSGEIVIRHAPDQRWGFVNRQRTPRGWRTVEWNRAPIFDESGEVVGYQASGRDITERISTLEGSLASNRRPGTLC